MTTTNDKNNTAYDPDDLQLGFIWQGRRLVCAGTDGIQEYERWLSELVEKYEQIEGMASNAVVELTINSPEGFVSAIGVDLNRDLNDQCPCSSYFYLGWMEPEEEKNIKARAQSLLWLLETEIYSGDVREMEEKIDDLEYRLRESDDKLIDLYKKIERSNSAFESYRKTLDQRTADREERLTRFFDVLAHRHFDSEEALVLGPIVQYGELFVLCTKEGDRLPHSRFYLSLWEMIRASGKFNTIEIEKKTRVPSGYGTKPLEVNEDWTNVWENPSHKNTKYYFAITRPDEPDIERQLETLIEEGLNAYVNFLDPEENDDDWE